MPATPSAVPVRPRFRPGPETVNPGGQALCPWRLPVPPRSPRSSPGSVNSARLANTSRIWSPSGCSRRTGSAGCGRSGERPSGGRLRRRSRISRSGECSTAPAPSGASRSTWPRSGSPGIRPPRRNDHRYACVQGCAAPLHRCSRAAGYRRHVRGHCRGVVRIDHRGPRSLGQSLTASLVPADADAAPRALEEAEPRQVRQPPRPWTPIGCTPSTPPGSGSPTPRCGRATPSTARSAWNAALPRVVGRNGRRAPPFPVGPFFVLRRRRLRPRSRYRFRPKSRPRPRRPTG